MASSDSLPSASPHPSPSVTPHDPLARLSRKSLYFKPEGYATDRSDAWSFVIIAFPWPNCDVDGYNVSVGYGDRGGVAHSLWGDTSQGFSPASNHLRSNTWYYIEAEVEYGSYGNDLLSIWLAVAGATPTLILERTDLGLRSSADAANGVGLGILEVGRQVDINRSSFSQSVDERRHWDELALATTRIGPIDGPDADAGGARDAGSASSKDAEPPEVGSKPIDGGREAGADGGALAECCDGSVLPDGASREPSGCACAFGRVSAGSASPFLLAGLAALASRMVRRRIPRRP